MWFTLSSKQYQVVCMEQFLKGAPNVKAYYVLGKCKMRSIYRNNLFLRDSAIKCNLGTNVGIAVVRKKLPMHPRTEDIFYWLL